MDLELRGKVVLVNAASKGLGRAIASEYAKEGAQVLISSRHEENLKDARALILKETGVEVAIFVADVSKKEDIEELYKKITQDYGRLDILITNSGGPLGGKFEDLSDDAWEHAFQSNLFSVIRLIRGSLPLLKASEGGHIINVASSSVKQPIEGLVLSNTYRAGIAGLSKTLASELAPFNIRVNTIAPGRIATDRTRSLDQAKAEALGVSVEEIEVQSSKNIPLGRYGTPSEFAKAVVFIGSSANRYITGQALLVDGGMVKGL